MYWFFLQKKPTYFNCETMVLGVFKNHSHQCRILCSVCNHGTTKLSVTDLANRYGVRHGRDRLLATQVKLYSYLYKIHGGARRPVQVFAYFCEYHLLYMGYNVCMWGGGTGGLPHLPIPLTRVVDPKWFFSDPTPDTTVKEVSTPDPVWDPATLVSALRNLRGNYTYVFET